MPSEVSRTCRIQMLETGLATVLGGMSSPSPFPSVVYGFCLRSPALERLLLVFCGPGGWRVAPMTVSVEDEAGVGGSGPSEGLVSGGH